MNELQLTKLVCDALDRSCDCRNGGSCAAATHTWRRAAHHNASRVFIERQSQRRTGCIALNIPSALDGDFSAAAHSIGIPCRLNDDRSPAFNRYVLLPRKTLADAEFLMTWVPLTID